MDSNLKQWDVVLADKVVQYDMDARPLFKRFHIPALNLDKLISSEEWKEKTYWQSSMQKMMLYWKSLIQ